MNFSNTKDLFSNTKRFATVCALMNGTQITNDRSCLYNSYFQYGSLLNHSTNTYSSVEWSHSSKACIMTWIKHWGALVERQQNAPWFSRTCNDVLTHPPQVNTLKRETGREGWRRKAVFTGSLCCLWIFLNELNTHSGHCLFDQATFHLCQKSYLH